MNGGSGSKAGSVASRFVSQSELDAARSGQSTSTSQQDDVYDPRSLYERLQQHKEAKDAKYDEMFKLSNQFRGIDDAEAEFLAQVASERKREEGEKERGEREELERFRAAKAAGSGTSIGRGVVGKAGKATSAGEPAKKSQSNDKEPNGSGTSTSAEAAKASASPAANKKKRKLQSSALLGVVKKKPSNSTSAPPNAPTSNPSPTAASTPSSTATASASPAKSSATTADDPSKT